mgnify:CR=1 FL=1|jgi:hypothetical protein
MTPPVEEPLDMPHAQTTSHGADSMAPLAGAHPGFFRRNAPKFIASAVMTACMLWALKKQDMSLVPPASAFAKVPHWWTVPVYVLFLAVMSLFRASRWRFLLRSSAEIPYRRIITVSWISFAAILVLPFRLGEFIRPMMIRDKGKISATAALGTVVAERIVDGLVLSAILGLSLFLIPTISPLPEHVVGLPSVPTSLVRRSAMGMFALFTGAFGTIAVFYFARNFARRATLAVFGIVSQKLAQKLADTASKLADGLHFLGRGRDAGPFLLETGLYWLVNACGMWVLAWGCGIVHEGGASITLGECFALMGMLGAAILIPGPPGMLGVFQVGIFCGMTLYFPEDIVKSNGAVFTFLLYVIQFAWTILAALGCLFDREAMASLKRSEDSVPATVEAA